jgi:CRISPR system Cascade subunit CasA
MNTFNLIDNPWIPVRWIDTAVQDKHSLVSLHDAFARAVEIADLDCAPHERIALTRLLVCITHAALGAPEDSDEWDGFGDDLTTAVPTYLQKPEIYPHFNLLGEEPRFLQKKSREDEGYVLSKIFFQLSSGNNPKLLDHWGEDARPWTPAVAALGLLCLQNFFVGGSMASKVRGNGPALKSLQMILLGSNLRETLLRNCLDLKSIGQTGGSLGNPVWDAAPDGNLLARLAPTPCALWLKDDLTRLLIDQGHQYLEYESYRDPYASTETNKDKRYLIRAKPDQGIWRDLHLLTNLQHVEGSSAPLNLQCFTNRKEWGETAELWVGELIKAKDAKIEDCVESSFTIAKDFFSPSGRNTYAAGIAFAEKISNSLYGAIKFYGSTLMHESPPTEEGKKHYWHSLDQNHKALIELAQKPNEQNGKPPIGSLAASDTWTELVRRSAKDAYATVCPCTTPRQIQAYVAGSKSLHKALYPKPEKTAKAAKVITSP